MTNPRAHKLLVVGQVPPPVHGQAIMIEAFLQGTYSTLQLYHVPMRFSSSIDDTGRLHWSKLRELIKVIYRITAARLRHNIPNVYYPPSGASLNGVLRDVAVLLCTRPLFRRTVFHLHAGGLPLTYDRLPRAAQMLLMQALGRPDLAIAISETTAQDARLLAPRKMTKVYNGITDLAGNRTRYRLPGVPVNILFMGSLREDKGVLVLLHACALLQQRGVDFRLTVAGGFASEEFRLTVHQFLEQRNGLAGRTEIPSVLLGDTQTQAYADADIFCFPTHYAAENFPVVLLEAMSFSLPVVSTRWRGVPEAVDEECGILVEPHDFHALADVLARLISDPSRRARMGAAGRKRFLENFSIEIFRNNMEHAVSDALST